MRCSICVFALLAAGLHSTAFADINMTGPFSFTPIGLANGAVSSRANAVSADGSVVVGEFALANGLTQAYRWTRTGGVVFLAGLPGAPIDDVADGVSADGTVIAGGSPSQLGYQAVVWSGAAYNVSPLVSPSGTFVDSGAGATSADASVIIGGKSAGTISHAFRWTASSGPILLDSSNVFTRAMGVSADGSVISGTYSVSVPMRAYRWTAATGIVFLDSLPTNTVFSKGDGISADGKVIVGFSTSTRTPNGEAVRWDAAGVHSLVSTPLPFASEADAASADGSIIVGRAAFDPSVSEAFIWDPANGMRNLRTILQADGVNLDGWVLGEGLSVSADGRTIVGIGTDPSGHQEGWIATLPEPASGSVVIAFIAMILVRRRC
jgi:probable HAF family extracellular repeat protein